MLFKVSTTTTRIVIKRMRVVDEVRPGRLVYPEAVHHQTIDGACAWWSGRSTRHYSRHRSLIRITMRRGALQEEKVVGESQFFDGSIYNWQYGLCVCFLWPTSGSVRGSSGE